MSGNSTDHWSGYDYVYGHGIICKECIARNCSEEGLAVRSISIGTFVQVHSVRDNDLLFRIVNDDMQVEPNRWICKKADIVRVPESLWGPLFAVKRTSRLALLEDNKTAEALGNISVGHTVQVLKSDGSVLCIANVAFKNSIERLGAGVFFGLQVLSPRDHLDAIIKKVSMLEPGTKGFPRCCDLVVTIERIHPNKPSHNKFKSIYFYEKENKKEANNMSAGEDVNNMNFKTMLLFNLKDKFGNSVKKPEPKSNSLDCNAFAKKILNTGELSGARGDFTFENDPMLPQGRCIQHKKSSTRDEADSANICPDIIGFSEKNEPQSSLIVSPSTPLVKFYDHKTNNTKELVPAKNNNDSSSICSNNNNNNSSNNNNNNNNNNNINNYNNNNLTVYNNNINYNSNNHNNKNNNNHTTTINTNKNNYSSMKISHNSNDHNNYFNNLKSSHICCEGRHHEQQNVARSNANSYPHPKNIEETICDLPENDFNADLFLSTYSCKNKDCKPVHPSSGLPKNSVSKSFDLGKPSDRKFHYKRHFNSVDSELLQNLTMVPQTSAAQDAYDSVGPNRVKTRDFHETCLEKKNYQDSGEDFQDQVTEIFSRIGLAGAVMHHDEHFVFVSVEKTEMSWRAKLTRWFTAGVIQANSSFGYISFGIAGHSDADNTGSS